MTILNKTKAQNEHLNPEQNNLEYKQLPETTQDHDSNAIHHAEHTIPTMQHSAARIMLWEFFSSSKKLVRAD